MPKNILVALAVTISFSASAAAQDERLETASDIEVSTQYGLSYLDSVTLNDNGSTLILDDVTTLDFGYIAERELARDDTFSLSGALSAQASFGEANDLKFNGLPTANEAEFRRLGGYADVIARLEGETEYDLTPYVSVGAGVVQDRVSLDNQVYKDLSPVGRYRAGVEKKFNDKVTLGIGAGQSFKLD